jgi:CRP-like cAMP-binding protein
MSNPLIQKLEQRFFLSDLDRKALEQASTRVQQVPARQDLIAEGDESDGAYLVLEGFACRYTVLPDGSRSIVAYFVPGDICDLHGSILAEVDHAIGTLSPCKIAIIPGEIIRDLTSNYPIIDHALRWVDLVDAAILRKWLINMGRRSADKQIAHILCELLVRLQAVYLATDNSYDFPIRQIDLADAVGLSNVHVSRVFKTLRSDDLIGFEGRGLRIPNVERLKAFAEFNPSYLHLEPKQQGNYNRKRSGAGRCGRVIQGGHRDQ